MKILILTGPSGAGKNTIAHELAKKVDHTVVIDVDLVRWMVVNPHKAPWDGKEGGLQHRLGVENTCLLAKNFLKNGFNVIVCDVINDDLARKYKETLFEYEPVIILLLPKFDEIVLRNKSREYRLADEEIERVYREQELLSSYEEKIDNTNLAVSEMVERLIEHMK